MSKGKFLIFVISALLLAAFSLGPEQCLAQQQPAAKESLSDFLAESKGKIKPSDIKAVAARMAAAKAAAKARAEAEGQNNQDQPAAPADKTEEGENE